MMHQKLGGLGAINDCAITQLEGDKSLAPAQSLGYFIDEELIKI